MLNVLFTTTDEGLLMLNVLFTAGEEGLMMLNVVFTAVEEGLIMLNVLFTAGEEGVLHGITQTDAAVVVASQVIFYRYFDVFQVLNIYYCTYQ